MTSERTEEMVAEISDRQLRMMQQMDERMERLEEKLSQNAGALRSLRQLVINIGKSDIPITLSGTRSLTQERNVFQEFEKLLRIKWKKYLLMYVCTRSLLHPGIEKSEDPPTTAFRAGALMKRLAPAVRVLEAAQGFQYRGEAGGVSIPSGIGVRGFDRCAAIFERSRGWRMRWRPRGASWQRWRMRSTKRTSRSRWTRNR